MTYRAPSGAPILSSPAPQSFWRSALVAVSAAACVYHGYRRSRSVPWALAWGGAATVFPIVTPAIAAAQGFGKEKQR